MTISPFGWQNWPSTTTPLDAALLEAFNSHLGTYIDAQVSSGPGAAVTATSSDSLGRTKLIARADSTPGAGTQAFATVLDAPWLAVGDAMRLTKTSITQGSNIVTDSAYTFTSGDIGKSLTIPGAGSQNPQINNPLWGYIGSVSAGAAVLMSAPSGGVAVNAAHSVTTNGVCHFGTDDTNAILAAITAVATAAAARGTVGILVFPGNRSYLMYGGLNNVFSNVVLWGYGATILQSAQAKGTLFSNGNSIIQSQVQNVAWFGFTFQGGGQYMGNTTTNNYDRYGAFGIYDAQHVIVQDCTIDGFSNTGIALNQAVNVKILGNTITNTVAAGLNNAIHIGLNLAFQSTPLLLSNDAAIAGNTVTGCAQACVCIQNGADNLSSPGPQPYRVRIGDNYLQTGDVFGNAWSGVAIEMGGYTPTYFNHTMRGITIHDNHIVHSGTVVNNLSQYAAGIVVTQDGGSGANDPLEIDAIDIHDNRIETMEGGINCNASHSHIHHNIISATPLSTASAITLGNWQGSPIVPIDTRCDHNTVVVGGNSPVSGIFAAWIDWLDVSDNKIVYALTNAVAANGLYVSHCTHPAVKGNQVRYAGQHGILLFSCSDAEVSGNRVYNPSGQTVAGYYGIYVDGCTASFVTPIYNNTCIDDRGAAKRMYTGIYVNGTSTYDEIRHNRCFGGTYTSASQGAINQSNSCIGIGPNVTDARTPTLGFFYISAPSSPYVYQNTSGYPLVFGLMNNHAATGLFIEIQRNTGSITIPTTLQAPFQEVWLDPGPKSGPNGSGGDTVTVNWSSGTAPVMYVRPARQA